MKLKRIFITTMFGLAALKVATMIYAATENPVTEITTVGELDKILKANKLVALEFYDRDCPVCKAFQRSGIFKEVATALPHIKFVIVSLQDGKPVHSEFKMARDQGGEGYPSFVFFRNEKQITFTRNGKQVNRFVGYVKNPLFTQKISAIFAQAELAAKNEAKTAAPVSQPELIEVKKALPTQ